MRTACCKLLSLIILLAFFAAGVTVFAFDAHADGINVANVHAHASADHVADTNGLDCPSGPEAGHDSHCSTASGVALIAPSVNATTAERSGSAVAYRSPMHPTADISGIDRPPRRA